MGNAVRRERLVPSTVWLELRRTTLELLLAITLLTGTASLIALSVGDPDSIAVVALSGLAVFFVGLAVLRLFDHLGRNGVPIIE